MKLMHGVVALLACVGFGQAATAVAEGPAASLLRLEVRPGAPQDPPVDELEALILLRPGTDEVELEIRAVDDSPSPADAEPAPDRPRVSYLEGEGDAYRAADGTFRTTAKASRPGGDALVEVVVRIPHSAIRAGAGVRMMRYTVSGRIGREDVFFASTRPIPVPALRVPPPAEVEIAPAPPAEPTPPLDETPRVLPTPQVPVKTLPAPQAPAKTAPAPMAPPSPEVGFAPRSAPAPQAPLAAPASPFRAWKTRPVHFATNRNLVALGGTPSQRFGDQVGDGVRYGSCTVNVPVERKPGTLDLPGRGEAADPSRHFLILGETVRFLDDAAFRGLVRGADTGRDVLVYVHGFNTAFDFAVVRMAQVVEDLEFAGTPVVFSWPAHEVAVPWPSDYSQDEANAERSYGALARVFKTLVEEQEARPADRRGKIHVIAHSLGNRVTMRAFSILDTLLPAGSKPMGQVVLAAPDVSIEDFTQLQPTIERRSERVSLYFNPNDQALWASYIRHGRERRAGNSAQFLRNLDNIDAAQVETEILGHGYWSAARPVLQDLHLLITMGWEPARRVPTVLQAFTRPQPYWGFPAPPSYWPFW